MLNVESPENIEDEQPTKEIPREKPLKAKAIEGMAYPDLREEEKVDKKQEKKATEEIKR